MKHRSRLIEVLHRAETGPIIDEAEFERKLVAPTIRSLLNKYDIRYDKSVIVPSDDDLADRVFQAGLELASEVGMFCQSTSRRINWTRNELEEGLRFCPHEVTLGCGNDAVTARARKPDDNERVIVAGGAYGTPVPEYMYIPMSLSYLKEPVIELIDNPSLESVYGYPVKAGSPWEVLAARREAELAIQAANIAGRPGISLGCVELSPTALGGLAGASWGAYRPTDWHHAPILSELKTNYDMLSIVAHVTRIGGVLEAYYNPIYGGFVGGAEGVAVAIVGGLILLNQIHMGDTLNTRPNHPFYNCDTTPELIWGTSLGIQALAKNTNLVLDTLSGPAGGPGTKTMLYENAAFVIATTVSGQSIMTSSHSASGGATPRHASGLDSKICGEVTHAVRGMSRAEANELVKQIIPLYIGELDKKPIGKPFEQVYDIEKIEPKPEWQGMYDEVRDELITLGLPLNRLKPEN
jgi:methylamine--corrinoid protein Co-methyltransferase